jgi:hypothetical protein
VSFESATEERERNSECKEFEGIKESPIRELFTSINQLRRVVYQYCLHRASKTHLVKVDGGGEVSKLAGSVRVAGSDLLAVDVGDTEVSPGLLLGVDDGHDSEGVFGTELRAVAPRDVDGRAGGAGDVGPGLGGSVLDVEPDDSAALNGPVVAGSKVEVVVAAGLVLGAVAAQVLDGPGQALGHGLAGGGSSGGDGMDSAAGGLGGLGGRSRGCWGGKSKSTVG